MEVLNRKTRFANSARSLGLTALVLCLCAGLAFLAVRQQELERYGREPESRAKSSPAATLVEKTGAVLASRTQTIKDITLRINDKLFAGDRIQTGAGARAVLQFPGGARLTLEQNSLLQLPGVQNGHETGALHLTAGAVHLDSADLAGVSTLVTPQAVIALNAPDLSLIRPPENRRTELAYIQGLAAAWFPDTGSQSAHKAERLLEQARKACEDMRRNTCRDASAKAWRELIALRNSSQREQRVELDITIEKSGKERIAVKSGAVNVTTQSRTLRVAQGGGLELDGAMPTRKSITAESLLTMVPRLPEKPKTPQPEPEPPHPAPPRQPDRSNDVFFEIESMQWQ